MQFSRCVGARNSTNINRTKAVTDETELDLIRLGDQPPKKKKKRNKHRSQVPESLPEDANDVTLALVADDQFRKAMHAAISAGLESAPTSVSTTPCTKRPVYISAERVALFGAAGAVFLDGKGGKLRPLPK
jgi:hypothetical protein